MPKRSRSPSLPPSSNSLRPSDHDLETVHTPKYYRGSSTSSTSSPPASGSDPAPHPMQCALPPHPPLTLPSAADFDAHYAREHTNRCSACRVNLPSPWLLELHLAEQHDPLITARREKGEKTYKCFMPTCDKVTRTPHKRRLHLVDKHGYPKGYDFRIVQTGMGKKISLLKSGGGGAQSCAGRRRRVSEVGEAGWQESAKERNDAGGTAERRSRRGTLENGQASRDGHETGYINGQRVGKDPQKQEPEMEVEKVSIAMEKLTKSAQQRDIDDDVDQLVNSVAALKFVPMSVRLKAGKSAS